MNTNINTISTESMQIMRNFIQGFEEFEQIVRGEKRGTPIDESLAKWDKWAEEVEEEEKNKNE
jgi:hypothetical protein